jgi:SAM-dependent methyltransferase
VSGKTTSRRKAERALERQLIYQQRKSLRLRGHEDELIREMQQVSRGVRNTLEQFRPIHLQSRVLEVGSGAHGMIFFFGTDVAIGVDPLALEYSKLFPEWQGRVLTIAAAGEMLPFDDESFDVVLCDNVVDHAESPERIVAELVRILRPGGLLYFTVNVHHPIYSLVSDLHGGWNALGIKYEIGPFADHTVHLTLTRAKRLFEGMPLRMLSETCDVSGAKARARSRPARHAGDFVKRLFYKNALYKVIATRG